MSAQTFMTPIKVKSAVDIVIDRLTQAIIDGTLKPGNRIPTEPELAESFQVGRNTVREAVRILVAYGILEIRRPEGTFVCDSFKPEGLNPMLYSLLLQKEDSYNDLVGLRECIESGIMLLLIQQGISSERVVELRNHAENIERAINAAPISYDQICEADIAFHDAIAKATNNRLLVMVNAMVAKLSVGSRIKTIKSLVEQGEEGKTYLIQTHYDLIDKIIKGDFSEMCNSVHSSYRYWANINNSAQ